MPSSAPTPGGANSPFGFTGEVPRQRRPPIFPVRSDTLRDWYNTRVNGTIGKLPTSGTSSALCRYLEADAAASPQ